MSAHASSRVSYFVTFALLMILLIVTVLVAQMHLGPWALSAAMLIAAAKVVLIAIVFMHLREEPSVIRLVATSGLFWLGLLFVLVASDYATRQ